MSNRDTYVQKFKAQLNQWNAEIDKLEAKVQKASANLKIGYREQIASLRDQRDQAKQKLLQIQDASEGAWEELKQGAEDVWGRTKEAFSKARSKFD